MRKEQKFYEIPKSFYSKLQQGEDYINKKGTIVPNEEVTTAAAKPKTYAFCADTIYDENLATKVKEVDLLYHETTYLKDLHERACSPFSQYHHPGCFHCSKSRGEKITDRAFFFKV